jgi:16S rRNA processing protein RimM
MRVEAVKVRGDGEVLVRFAGFDSPEKAKTLSGSEVIVDRKDAAPLGEGEFYIEDLKGLRLVADRKAGGTEKVFGIIIGVVEGGGGLLLDIQSGGDAADSGTRFIPFRKEFIGEVLPEEGTVVLRAPWALA